MDRPLFSARKKGQFERFLFLQLTCRYFFGRIEWLPAGRLVPLVNRCAETPQAQPKTLLH